MYPLILQRSLKILDASHNKIAEIPENIDRLKNLEILDFRLNNIKSIPANIHKLTKLRVLALQFNEISSLPDEIVNLELDFFSGHSGDTINQFNDGIYLSVGHIISPPSEIVRKGRKALIEYLESIRGGVKSLNEVKVLVLGDGGAGKTSLVKRAVGKKFNKNESRTHGINIADWKINYRGKEIHAHFWDFGGQEIMHATHQFFLSQRSLYILVVDDRKDSKAEYWIQHIESFGGQSPILVVVNKIDESNSYDLNQTFLQEKYQSIKSFHRLSCKTGRGIKSFTNTLKKELSRVEIINTEWPQSWFNVKSKLLKTNKNYISRSGFDAICLENGIHGEPTKTTLIEFLNDLGIALHFDEFDLEEIHVIEPKWITQAVYKIINSNELSRNKGILRLKSLKKILKKTRSVDYEYPSETYFFIISLMKKFELCYQIDPETILIPDLLEIQEPIIKHDFSSALQFVLQYEFIPKTIIPRFIVKMHTDIVDDLRWRSGAVLTNPSFEATALIKLDEEARKIFIQVRGPQKRDYFAVVLHSFREINHSFNKIAVKEVIPLVDCLDVLVSYSHLLLLEKKGIKPPLKN